MRAATQGPAGSPLNSNAPTFSPTNNLPQQPVGGYNPLPPNPYTPTPPHGHPTEAPYPQFSPYNTAPPGQQMYTPHPNPLINEILGPLQMCTTAQQVIAADSNLPREKLVNLRKVLEEHPETRDDMQKFWEWIK
jgi:hypothetical protein